MKASFFMVLWEVERRDCVCWYITFLFCSLHHTFDVAFPAAFAFLRIMRCLVLPYVLGKYWKICLNKILCSVLYSITVLTVINYSINFVGKGPWRYKVFFPTSLLSCLASTGETATWFSVPHVSVLRTRPSKETPQLQVLLRTITIFFE